ncbi:MAG TPA: M48 family metalloprotease [Terracidiphilus sp.]|nr:M48 family metalloprotease [Terracidiphilus sp.]
MARVNSSPSHRLTHRLFGILLFLTMARMAAAISPVCALRPPRMRVSRADIFSEQQEQWLGDAQAEMIEPRYTLLPANDSSYLNEIGQRLLAQLPPASIHYTFRVFESPELRAFSVAGGHIYVSRKLIMDARSEDELAAMLAQEIGRVYIHHSASVVTLRLERLLHIKTLGGRDDVFDKFERVLNIPPDYYSELTASDLEHDELLADQVGLYAMVKAQYAPEAFAAFLDRVNNNGGYTGNLFTDLLDLTPEISIRVRMAHKTVNQLPASCRRSRPIYHPGFKPFRDALRLSRIDPIVPPTPGLPSFPLEPAMNPALENVLLSQDGKYMLAQDSYQIHLFSTSPLKLLFSVDALGAEMAQFTPDSKDLVFNYNDLHIEKWDLASRQPVNIVDYVDYAGCVQTSLSPDGNALACVSYNGDSVWLKIVDVNTFQMLYQNMNFYEPFPNLSMASLGFNPNFQALMRWTRDGRYFVAASGTSAMAYDLQHRREIRLEKNLSGLVQQRFAFVGSDRIVSTCDWTIKTGTVGETMRMCYNTFPAGASIHTFQLPFGWLSSVSSGQSLLFGPTNTSAAVLLDPSAGRVTAGFPMETIDVLGDTLASETPQGGIGLGKLGGQVQVTALPITPLANIEASAFSPNGRYLAVSDRARAAEWDLETRKRIAEIGPCRALEIDNQGRLQALPIRHELNPSINPSLDKLMHKYVPGLTARGDPIQYGAIRLRVKPRGILHSPNEDVDLEAYDANSEAHLWTTRFEFNVPNIVPADGDKLLFVMGRRSPAGNSEVSRNKKRLIQTSDKQNQLLTEFGTLVEIVSGRTGAVERAIIAPPISSPRREERTAALFGNLLAVYGNHNDTAIYRTSDGKRLAGFFGRALAADEQLGLVAATNRLQELSLYDVAGGQRRAHLLLDQEIIAARFVPENKQLLVLTANQHVYRLDIPALETMPAQ